MATVKESFDPNRSHKAELLVSGFVKEADLEKSFLEGLVQFFFLWYFMNEKWDKEIKGDGIEIIDDLSICSYRL